MLALLWMATFLAAVGAAGGQWVWCGAGELPHILGAHRGGRILCLAGAGTGATVWVGPKLGLQPIAVSSLTVKGAEGLQAGGVRWLLGAGCWLMAASRAGGPRVLRGAGTDGGREGEWGGPSAPHPPTAPGATGGLEEAPLSVWMAQGAGQHRAAAVGALRGPALPGRVKEVRWDVAPSPGC